MNNRKILMTENDAHAVQLAESLRIRYKPFGIDVNVFKNFSDLEYYIENEKKRENIGVIFLDASMNPRALDEDLREEAKKIGFSGWIFYDKVLKEEYKELYDITILYTSYGNELYAKLIKYGIIKTQEEFDKIPILHKKDENMIKNAKEMADKLLNL